MRSTLGVGRAVAGQEDFYAAPLRAWQNPGTAQGVIICHGFIGDLVATPSAVGLAFEYSIGVPLFNHLREQFAYAEGDFSNDAWGNDTAIANVETMRSWMQSSMGAKSGKVALVGISMGGLTALNYAMAHPENVACVVGLIPAVNLQALLSNPAGTDSINAAYGGTYDDSRDGPMHNPVVYASDFPNVPVHLYYSTADTGVLPQYAEQFIANCPTAQGTAVSTTLDHSNAAVAAADMNDIVKFIRNGNW
jgi:dienelactone hydrolase